MSIIDEVNNKLKEAVKNNDVLMKNAIRSVKSKISEFMVANLLPRDNITDDVVINVMTTNRKSLLKAIDELVPYKERTQPIIDEYMVEIKFCEHYIPKSLSVDEVTNIVITEAKESNIVAPNQSGKLIGMVMKKNKGLDGLVVKSAVEKYLNRKE
jgi:uncharacterized protein YqeY